MIAHITSEETDFEIDNFHTFQTSVSLNLTSYGIASCVLFDLCLVYITNFVEIVKLVVDDTQTDGWT